MKHYRTHERATDETRETAALYCLGALSPDEAGAFETHLATGCAPCEAEVRAFRGAAAELAHLAEPADPPPGLRARLIDRISVGKAGSPPRDDRTFDARADGTRAHGARSDDASVHVEHAPMQVWKRWGGEGATPSWFTLRADEGSWEGTGVDGVSVRRLFVDATRQTVTMLVKMAAGTSYPSHRHGGAEECFVLDGDLHVGELVMRAGDYQRAEKESVHVVQSTERGCTLLIVSSLHDEIIE